MCYTKIENVLDCYENVIVGGFEFMFLHYLTSEKTGDRINLVDYSTSESDSIISVDRRERYQEIIGFGGAFTESAAFTLSMMSKADRQRVIDLYFNQESGLKYNIGRVHINSSDFSLGNYTYVENNDVLLKTFDIRREKKLVIPLIKDAEKASGKKIDLLASPWSPPEWMKSNNEMNNGGKLLPRYYESWAKYYVKFIDEFRKQGLNIEYITVQNEPAAKQTWDSCLYTAEEERDFVRDYLGPILHAKYPDVKIIIWDHNRDIIVERGDTVLKDKEARDHVWGTGVHWYVSEEFENLSKLHNLHPDKHLLFTEGCIEGGVHLGAWHTGERYARNMIGDFQNYCEGYIDWNITLNEIGGPNHVGNYCDAPIISDTVNQELHLNSSYYYIGHFSKFVPKGSRRISSKSNSEDLKNVAFETPDGEIVLIILNETANEHKTSIKIDNINRDLLIPSHTISTITYRE